MLLGVVLLYVGVVLAVNGIWLIGQARAAAEASLMPAMERETSAVGSATGRGLAREAAAGQELAGEPVTAPPRLNAQASPWYIQNREVSILNIFTGFTGIAVALLYLVLGGTATLAVLGLPSVRASAFILLFAFTYLWVAYNQYANAGGRGLGWYSLFVAITAIVFGVYTVQNTPGTNTADLWLAGNWFAWAVLWGLFWALLSLELPIARITGWVALIEGVGTSWALAIALLWDKLAFA
jgi:putative amide transporter protein